jgi:hypothetical protein
MNMKNKIFSSLLVLFLSFVQGCGLFPDHGRKLKFGAGEVFYKDGVTKDEAEKLGNYLLSEEFFDEKEPKSVQLLKRGDVYVLRMVTLPDYIDNPEFERTILFAGMDISSDVFSGSRVDIELTDQLFNPQKTIKSAGVRKKYGEADVYRFHSVEESTADKVTEFLMLIGFIGKNEMSLVYDMKNDTFLYEMVTGDGVENDTAVVEANMIIAGILSKEVLEDKPVELHFLRTDYTLKRIFTYQEVLKVAEAFSAEDLL